MWLTVDLAKWYVEGLLAKGSDLLAVVPKVGALFLIAGAILGIVQRRRRLILFLIPVAASHVFVLAAGLFHDALRYPSKNGSVPSYTFLFGEVVVCLYLIYRLKGARLAALFLSVFTLAYAWEAGFDAAMALTGDWL